MRVVIEIPFPDLITFQAANIWGKFFLNWSLFILDNLYKQIFHFLKSFWNLADPNMQDVWFWSFEDVK